MPPCSLAYCQPLRRGDTTFVRHAETKMTSEAQKLHISKHILGCPCEVWVSDFQRLQRLFLSCSLDGQSDTLLAPDKGYQGRQFRSSWTRRRWCFFGDPWCCSFTGCIHPAAKAWSQRETFWRPWQRHQVWVFVARKMRIFWTFSDGWVDFFQQLPRCHCSLPAVVGYHFQRGSVVAGYFFSLSFQHVSIHLTWILAPDSIGEVEGCPFGVMNGGRGSNLGKWAETNGQIEARVSKSLPETNGCWQSRLLGFVVSCQ